MNEVDMSEVAPRRSGSIGRSLRVVASFASAGLVLGVLWALTAPVEHVAAVGDGRAIVLTGESDHRFDALALFLCVTAAAGVVVTVGVWSVVSDRGPRLVIETVLGAFAGSGVAIGVGLVVGSLRYASAEGAARGDVVGLAPGLSTPLALLAQPLAAAVTVVLIAALSASDDLRRGDTADASDESMSGS